MTTPIWAPGTLYQPGDIVQRRSAPPVVQSAPTNPSFESGATGWSFSFPFGVSSTAPPGAYDGANYLEMNGAFLGGATFTNDNVVPVRPGQTINASCFVNTVASSNADWQRGAITIFWYDIDSNFISASEGLQIQLTHGAWRQSTVNASAPSNAAFATIGATGRRFANTFAVCFDAFSWDYTYSEPLDGLVFRAVQTNAGYSGVDEPTWPDDVGETVVDNEVTWEAFEAPSIIWQAGPILLSGATEPTWPLSVGGEVLDNTISWVATTGQVTDSKCPNTVPVAIAASKVFAGDDDIVRYSATINPLDWSTANDAGYLPFGLQTYGSSPVTALGLYRGNIVVFNAASFQMWQVDQDPANMALLDAVPVGCVYPRSVQPLMNDLLFLSKVGVRGIAIAGASTNLQADGVGEPVDPLVVAKIKAGTYEPIAINYPAGGQYWLVFGPEAFVLTINGAKSRSWSRYVFPEAITDWTIHNGDLYLRAGDHVWKFDDEQVDDDVVNPSVTFTGGNFEPLPVVLAAELAGGEIDLEWTEGEAPGSAVEEYDVYRSEDGGAFSVHATVPAAQLAYADIGVDIGTEYAYYVVTKADNGLESEPSNTVEETPVNEGLLVAQSTPYVSVSGAPSNCAVHPNGQHLYVSDYTNSRILQFDIDPTDGSLTPMSVPFVGTGTLPLAIVISPNGDFLYSMGAGSDMVYQFAIDGDGQLSALVPASVATGDNPQTAAISQDGQYLYVACATPSDVYQYSIGVDGLLTPLGTPFVSVPAVGSPQRIRICRDPSSDYIYVINETVDAVNQYTVGVGGLLTPLSPATVACTNLPVDVLVDRSGTYAYVSGFTGPLVSQYAKGSDGQLTVLSPATVSGNITMASPGGNYVYGVVGPSDIATQYRISAGGQLDPLSPSSVAAGDNPSDIAVTPDGLYAYVCSFADNRVYQYEIQ